MALADSGARRDEQKLHANHGKPCANLLCNQPLITGRIHAAIYCDRNACGPRGLAGQITAKRKAAKAEEKAVKRVKGAGAVCSAAAWKMHEAVLTLEERRRVQEMDVRTLEAEATAIQAELEAVLRVASHLSQRVDFVWATHGIKSAAVAPCLVPSPPLPPQPQPPPQPPPPPKPQPTTVQQPAEEITQQPAKENQPPPLRQSATRSEIKELIAAAFERGSFRLGAFRGWRLRELGLSSEQLMPHRSYLGLHTEKGDPDFFMLTKSVWGKHSQYSC